MIIRIYTEDKNRDRIHAICQEHLVGYTLIPCEGIWKGAKENSLVIEVIGDAVVGYEIRITVKPAGTPV